MTSGWNHPDQTEERHLLGEVQAPKRALLTRPRFARLSCAPVGRLAVQPAKRAILR